MAEHQSPETHTVPETSSGINSLIAAANTTDRFKLLEDNCVPAANLNNPIHPIFLCFDCDGPMKQTLHLASQFLTHDSVLAFFVPLLYGHELTRIDSGATKPYLSNPIANASGAKRKKLFDGVRRALHCLAHSVELRFMKPEKRVYARTLTSTARPTHTSTCSPIFQRNMTAVIEIADRFMHFYYSKDGYKASSRCAQFRHDFLFASTLVHEVVHAFGVMRRGNLIEACIRTDHPDTEWGYAWEHFVFGCVINPQDRTRLGTYLLMRKIWADPMIAEEAGGKEYCDVPMFYIAQWFRQETWDIIMEHGPTAIALPPTHFKIQSSRKYGAWVVSSDCLDVKQDIMALLQQWNQQSRKLGANGLPVSASAKIFWRFQTTKALQKSNVSAPLRILWKPKYDQACGQVADARKVPNTIVSRTCEQSIYEVASTDSGGSSRKRRARAETETLRVRKKAKT